MPRRVKAVPGNRHSKEPAAQCGRCLRVFTHGKEEWAVDSCKVIPLHEFEDRQLLAIYPGSAGEVPADLKPRPFSAATATEPVRALVVAGMGFERYRLADMLHVLHQEIKVQPGWVRMDRGRMLFDGFPENPRDLFQYSIIYFCDASARCLGLKVKNALCEYVKRGGAVVVLGGHQAYERGGWRGSMLEEVMPVEPAAELKAGIHAFPNGQGLVLDAAVPGRGGLGDASQALVYYLHRVTLKPGAQVWAKAGDAPFLVAGTCGQGRVVCILAPPWGDPGPTATPFWSWDGWILLLREVSWWAEKNGGT